MKLDKPLSKNINHQPHRKWGAVRVFEKSDEQYLYRLSAEVSAACIRFFNKRGMPHGFQSMNSSWWNDKQAKQAQAQA